MPSAVKPYKAAQFRIKRESLKPTKKLVSAQKLLAKIMGDNFEFIARYTDEYFTMKKSGASGETIAAHYFEWNGRVAPDGKINCIMRRDVARKIERDLLKEAMDLQKMRSGPSSIERITPVEAALLGNEYVDPGFWTDPESKANALENRKGTDAAESRYATYQESLRKMEMRAKGIYVK